MVQFTDCIAPRPFLFSLTRFFSPRLLRQALAFSARNFRSRQLPAHLVLLVLIAGFLQGKLGLPRILAWLGFAHPGLEISDQALYQARQRLGWRPVWWLRHHAVNWLAHLQRDPTAFFHGQRLIAVDGTILTVADSPENERVFGKYRNQHKFSAFPLIRVLALCEIGTHGLIRWIARSCRVSESKLLSRLIHHVPARSLLIADRNFHSWTLWDTAKRAEFSLLIRVQSGPRFPVLERFSDGSYRSHVIPRRGKNKKRRAIAVRVVECQITIGTRTTTFRLLTSLLDPTQATARQIVDLYTRRWEIETAFAEFKSQLAERTTALRSMHPQTVMAELDALLIGYSVVRRLALRAARREGVDPLTISFRQAVQTMVYSVVCPPRTVAELERRIARHRNERRKRTCRRCRKAVRCAWPVKQPGEHSVRNQTVTITITPPKPLS